MGQLQAIHKYTPSFRMLFRNNCSKHPSSTGDLVHSST